MPMNERLLALALLAFCLFHYPLLSLPTTPLAQGAYLLGAWGLVIGLAYRITRAAAHAASKDESS